MKEISVRKVENKDGSESITYRKEWKKNGVTHTKEVRQVEGGYIIRESKWGKPEGDEEAEYMDETKEYVSTENPFKKKEESSDEEKMFNFIDSPLM